MPPAQADEAKAVSVFALTLTGTRLSSCTDPNSPIQMIIGK
jgi:hypothetical protein